MFDELLNLDIKTFSVSQLKTLIHRTLPIVILHTRMIQKLITGYDNNHTSLTNMTYIENYFKNLPGETDKRWCTVAEASKRLGRTRAIVHRWVNEDNNIIHTNGMTGRQKLVYFPDILYREFQAEQKKLKKELDELQLDVRKIPNKH